MEIEYKFKRFLDELQAAIVLAGGIKLDTDYLKSLSVEELFKLVTPNNIVLSVRLE